MNRTLGWRYAFPLTAAIGYGAGSVLIRKGVSDLAHPLVGATMALIVGTSVLSFAGTRDFNVVVNHNRRALGFLLISGLTSSIGLISNYFALSIAPVVVVAPLISTSPLITLLCAHLFLQRLERVTPRIVMGAFLVVFGVVLITLGRIL